MTSKITITPKHGIVQTLADFQNLKPGTTLYAANATGVEWWYYGGINPKSPRSIILINSGNVNHFTGLYIGDKEEVHNYPFLLSYNDAQLQLIANAEANLEQVKRIFTPIEEELT